MTRRTQSIEYKQIPASKNAVVMRDYGPRGGGVLALTLTPYALD